MRTRKLITTAFFCIFFCILQCTVAFASCSTARCTGLIERLFFTSAGALYIATDGDERNLNCSAPGDVYITMTAESPVFNEQYAMLLTAMTLEQEVGLRIVEGSSNCALSYITIDIPK